VTKSGAVNRVRWRKTVDDLYVLNRSKDYIIIIILMREGCSNKPRTTDDVKKKCRCLVSSVSPPERRRELNMFVRCDACLRSKRNHFQHLL
jgi:hypothetical protein